MSRRCELTGVGVQSGNNVSHSERKTRRRFLPNLHNVTLRSDLLDRDFKFRIAARALKTVEAQGGLDNFLMKQKVDLLSRDAKFARKLILSKKEA